jgi:ubiquinone/menaquinone biosynthesis C-methylase UbiE
MDDRLSAAAPSDRTAPQTSPRPNTADPWFNWLTHQRHGGHAACRQSVLNTVERIRDRVLDGAQLSEGMTMIDVGAGDGLIAFGAISRIGPRLKVILADKSTLLLDRAKSLAHEGGFQDQCAFLQTCAEDMPAMPDASVDVVTTRSVLVYLANKPKAVREFHRILKPGGRVSIAEPIYRDESLHLTAFVNFLKDRPPDAATLDAGLFLRYKQAQFPSTLEDIAANPLTNFSERDLIAIIERAGFLHPHLELHIDIQKSIPMSWDTFLDSAHHPTAPTVQEILASQFTEKERHRFEEGLRPVVESGQILNRDVIAYLTAVKPE